MLTASGPTPTKLYRDNLRALRFFQPDVAGAIDAAAVPDGVRRAKGRDGSDTFMIPAESGGDGWFGHTSMPTVSAAELFGHVRRDQGNVILPGILSGVEPLLMAQRLADYAAVFVIEPSAVMLKLAMQLHDYAPSIRAGRLVLIHGGDLSTAMRRFFEEHPGYEYPGRLFNAPHVSAAESARMQQAVEQAGEDVIASYAVRLQRQREAIERQCTRIEAGWVLPDRPRVAVLSVEAGETSLRQVARVQAALRRMDWPFIECMPNCPGKCHATARLTAIERACADLVLFVNSAPRQFRSLLPRNLPVVSWFLPGAAAVGVTDENCGPFDLIVASTPEQAMNLTGAGVSGRRIVRVEPAADTVVFQPGGKGEGIGAGLIEAAILMDIADTSAEASNITLASHVHLWNAMRRAVEGAVDRYHDNLAGELFDQAQRESGTTLQDRDLRDRFVEMLRRTLAPAVIAQYTHKTLTDAGVRVDTWGNGWPEPDGGAKSSLGPIPANAELNALFNRAAWIVLPVFHEIAVQAALDALAAGAHVAMRKPEKAFERLYPDLRSLLPFLSFFGAPRELLGLIRRRSARTEFAKSRMVMHGAVAEAHTVAHRLTEIAARVRSRQRQPGPS